MNQLFLFRKEMTPIRKLLLMKLAAGGVPLSEYTVAGNPLTFDTNVAMPLKSLLVPFTPTQSGTGDPSPTNVRPISGVSAVNVWQTGKNLYNYNENNVKKETTSTSTTRAVYHTGLKNGTYTLSGALKTGETAPSYGINCGTFANNVATVVYSFIGNSSDVAIVRTITVGENEEVVFINPSETITDLQNKLVRYNLQIELGTVAEPVYSPYTGQSYPVTFPALGKNLLNPSVFASAAENYAVSNGVITVKKSDDRAWTSVAEIDFHSGTYTISRSNAQGRLTVKASIDNYDSAFVNTLDASATFTLSADCKIKIKLSGSSATYPYDTTLQIESGSFATSYEPYTNTVYGGSLDVTTGVLTVEWVGLEASSLTWQESSAISRSVFSTNISQDNLPARDVSNNLNIVCDSYKTITANTSINNMDEGIKGNSNYESVFYIRDTRYETLQEFKANVDCFFVYQIATPYTIQLSPTEITALLGDNTIWSDTNGSNTAVYYKKG